MKQWWQNLQPREQHLVILLLPFIVIFLFYQIVWSPLQESIDKADKKLTRQQELLVWVNTETARLKQAQHSGAKVRSGSISSIVNRSARQNQITIARLQPQNNDVQVWVDNIEFNRLIDWLASLSNEHNIIVKSIDLSQGDAAGEVKVKRLQLGS